MSSALAIQETIIAQPITQPAKRPWDRRPNEPTKWHERFTLYRDMGPSRSIAEAYRRYRIDHSNAVTLATDCNAPSTWYDNARLYDWEKRATLFDDWLNRDIDKQIKNKVRRWKAKAIDDMARCWDDLQVEWKSVETGQMSRNQISQSMKTMSREISSMVPEVTTGISLEIILDKLPAETQQALVEALKHS